MKDKISIFIHAIFLLLFIICFLGAGFYPILTKIYILFVSLNIINARASYVITTQNKFGMKNVDLRQFFQLTFYNLFLGAWFFPILVEFQPQLIKQEAACWCLI